MTTLLYLSIDVAPADMDAHDPVTATAERVWRLLCESGLVVHHVGQHLPGHDALHVDDATREALADATDTMAEPDPLTCNHPGCTESFTQPNHLKLHQRSHETKPCQWCGRSVGVAGLASHERHCDERPVEAGVTIAAPQLDRDPKLPDRKPLLADLGPIEKRPFDPDKVRAAAGGW